MMRKNLQNLKFQIRWEYFTLATRFGYVTIGEVKNGLKVQLSVKVGTVIYKVKCCNEIYQKHIDQLRFYPDIETELEVKDISQLEQNLSLHPIFHSIEPDQSNQTIISPPSNNTLSEPHQHIITSISWHPSIH